MRSGLLLLLMVGWAQAQSASAPNSSLHYRISATLTDSCPVQKTVNVHPLRFDFHNASCQSRKHVSERKVPTLPQSPRSKNVRIAGYHFSDWSDGLLSPNTRNAENIDLTFTSATLTASGWLGKALCSAKPSGKPVVEDSFWQSSVVPEVQFEDDSEHSEEPVSAEVVPPQEIAVLTLPVACADPTQMLQYSVTPVVDGVAQDSIYTSPQLAIQKSAAENGTTSGNVSISGGWSAVFAEGRSELKVTVKSTAVGVPK